jgi:nitrate/nitrite transporter NarK
VLVGGVLLDVVGGRETMLLIALVLMLISAAFSLSPSMRHAVAGNGRR